MTSLDEVDRKLSQVLKEIQTIQVDLKSVKRAVNESHAADVGMASMTAEDIQSFTEPHKSREQNPARTHARYRQTALKADP
jgi:hypothetical protein